MQIKKVNETMNACDKNKRCIDNKHGCKKKVQVW
jgi:hypothetical protein